jgi:hypothetical protein
LHTNIPTVAHHNQMFAESINASVSIGARSALLNRG